jgi:hypothetical protein
MHGLATRSKLSYREMRQFIWNLSFRGKAKPTTEAGRRGEQQEGEEECLLRLRYHLLLEASHVDSSGEKAN